MRSGAACTTTSSNTWSPALSAVEDLQHLHGDSERNSSFGFRFNTGFFPESEALPLDCFSSCALFSSLAVLPLPCLNVSFIYDTVDCLCGLRQNRAFDGFIPITSILLSSAGHNRPVKFISSTIRYPAMKNHLNLSRDIWPVSNLILIIGNTQALQL